MLGSDAVALTSYRYSAHLSLSRLGNSGRTGIDRARQHGGTPHAQNLGEDQVILRRKPHRAAGAENEQPQEYELDATKRGSDGQPYTPEEIKEIEELKERDLEVRRHEQAHFRAGGRYASPPKYEYQTGPDGRRYAIGGSVDIDMSEVPNDPQATLEKARIIKRAALAPEEPSAQDRKVAREADEMAVDAQKQISEERLTRVETGMESTREPVTVKPIPQAAESQAVEPVDIEPIQFAAEPFSRSVVPRYNTSRLEMSGFGAFRIAQLASPAHNAIAGLYAKLDVYA